MKKNARKRQRRQIKRIESEHGPIDPILTKQLLEIHRRANVIKLRAYEVVDEAKTPEDRAIMETECCRAMALRAGEKKLRYRPSCWDRSFDNWMVGS